MTRAPPRTATVLIGLRGSGKTTLGRLLAARRAVPFVDLDDRTVASAAHASVSAMFRAVGEAAFRQAERAALEAALAGDAAAASVIALGGGTPTAPGARGMLEAARDAGRIRIVLLEAPPAVLGARLSVAPGDRPLLMGADFAEEATLLAERRMPAYRALAQATVSTARPTADSLAELERVA
ncbi:MAG: shikimate kinase [Phycisphaerales bacterium]|nr:shikimate kinase [Phycisphaerales bacterium]